MDEKDQTRAKLKLCTDSETLGRFTNSSILHSPIHTNRGLSTSSSLHYPIQQRDHLSPSNVEQFVLFSRPFRSSMSKVPYEFAKIRGEETRDPRIVTTHSRADSTGWCVRVWPIASKLEIVPVNNASRGLETWRRKRSLV